MNARSAFCATSAASATLFLLVNCSTDAGSVAHGSPGGESSNPAGHGGASTAGSSGGGVSGGGAAGSYAAAGTASHGGSAGTANNGGSAGAAVAASFQTLKDVLATSCFGAGCHSEMGNPLQMELNDKLYGTLTSYTTRTCGKLLDTSNASQSALIKLLQGSCNGVNRMPYGVCVEDGDPSCIAPEYIAAIKAWIAQGAPRE